MMKRIILVHENGLRRVLGRFDGPPAEIFEANDGKDVFVCGFVRDHERYTEYAVLAIQQTPTAADPQLVPVPEVETTHE